MEGLDRKLIKDSFFSSLTITHMYKTHLIILCGIGTVKQKKVRYFAIAIYFIYGILIIETGRSSLIESSR